MVGHLAIGRSYIPLHLFACSLVFEGAFLPNIRGMDIRNRQHELNIRFEELRTLTLPEINHSVLISTISSEVVVV